MDKVRQFVAFVKEAIEELKKVTWLPRKQMMAQTVLVAVLVLVFAVFVGALDFVVTRLFGFII